jgi:hypothetical protein
MPYITLTQGKRALVDYDDYHILNAFKWYYSNGYAVRKVQRFGRSRTILMHRVINDTPKGMETDHINRSTLDNRRLNLRSVTNTQNHYNRHAIPKSKSKYKGVWWHTERSKWAAQITFDGKKILLGRFDKEEDAAETYNVAAYHLHGSYACFNKIPESRYA